ncbi:MAG: hypothetical protein ACTSYF_05125 [Promethearchaeota archaeon]
MIKDPENMKIDMYNRRINRNGTFNNSAGVDISAFRYGDFLDKPSCYGGFRICFGINSPDQEIKVDHV